MMVLWTPWNAAAAVADASEWHMRPVTSYQARVDAFVPIWDEEHEAWVSGLDGPDAELTFEERYAATLDSVTTSSVEGALMYLQRDCIDRGEAPMDVGCKRKNDVKTIVFLEVTIVNPNAALAEYQSNRYTYPEFCPFMEMRGGQCVQTNVTGWNETVTPNPTECKQFNGLDGQPDIGPCVGAHAFPTDNIAPYPDTVWFSYPNSCVMKSWKEGKNAKCREEYPGGLCPFGTKPDGVTCSFSYKILGYLLIDDLVGITSMEITGSEIEASTLEGSSKEGEIESETTESTEEETTSASEESSRRLSDGYYADYEEFCMDNNTEFHSFDTDKTLGLSNVKAISFWNAPSNSDANKNRTAFMIEMYNNQTKNEKSKMAPLPLDLNALAKNNPPCYENAKACYDAHYGCERHSYAQVCSVCRAMKEKCQVKTPAYTFPTLAKAPRSASDASSSSSEKSVTSPSSHGHQTLLNSSMILGIGLLGVMMHF
ncbi:hypothetical protein Poli38472_007812 [Pythium oligandrum]|uniref:Uncharacterized protein n=1 Tax=Pythium oligandrum TaxID=41045 RepID=A0A8K1CRD0_PYTOL|nr:hypothetical protein Poli38472_007812 [Pythium oligandrum]|eukprot:TMW68140.1 hypothetical protein Poli38472_007812 [Pythium oligandrum]